MSISRKSLFACGAVLIAALGVSADDAYNHECIDSIFSTLKPALEANCQNGQLSQALGPAAEAGAKGFLCSGDKAANTYALSNQAIEFLKLAPCTAFTSNDPSVQPLLTALGVGGGNASASASVAIGSNTGLAQFNAGSASSESGPAATGAAKSTDSASGSGAASATSSGAAVASGGVHLNAAGNATANGTASGNATLKNAAATASGGAKNGTNNAAASGAAMRGASLGLSGAGAWMGVVGTGVFVVLGSALVL